MFEIIKMIGGVFFKGLKGGEGKYGVTEQALRSPGIRWGLCGAVFLFLLISLFTIFPQYIPIDYDADALVLFHERLWTIVWTLLGGGSIVLASNSKARKAIADKLTAHQDAMDAEKKRKQTELKSFMEGDNTFYLQRMNTEKGVVLGEWMHKGKSLFDTLELAWRNNKRSKSCIPPGKYRLIRCDRKILKVVINDADLHGERHNIGPHGTDSDRPARKQIKGCIAICVGGYSKGGAMGEYYSTAGGSRKAVAKLLDIMDANPKTQFYLEIMGR